MPEPETGPPLDLERVKGQLAQQGILIDSSDPAFKILLANKIVLENYTAGVTARFDEAVTRLEKTVARAIRETDQLASKAVITSSRTVLNHAAEDLVKALRQELAPLQRKVKTLYAVAVLSFLALSFLLVLRLA